MKIVIISPFQYRLVRGVEIYVQIVSNLFAAKGLDVIVYSNSGSVISRSETFDLMCQERRFIVPRYFRRFWLGLYYRYWIRIDKPDLILINFLYHGELSLSKLNIPLFYVLHSPADTIPNRYEFIRKSGVKDLHFIAVSNYVKEMALPYLGHNIEVINNGVMLNDDKVKCEVPTATEFSLVSVGALENRKNHVELILLISELIKRYPSAGITLDIYGEGEQREELEKLINSLELNSLIRLCGVTKNLTSSLKNYHAFILLSHGEASPLAPLEAAAAGLPVIIKPVRPYDEIFGDNYPLYVSDYNSLEKVYQELLSNVRHYNDYSLSVAKRFSWDLIVDKYLALFKRYV